MVYSENSDRKDSDLFPVEVQHHTNQLLAVCDSVVKKKITSLQVVVKFVSGLGGAAVPVHSGLQGVLPAIC